MQRPIHVRFEGLRSPILLHGCEELLAPMAQILPGWPLAVTPAASDVEAAATIRPLGRGRYEIASHLIDGEPRVYDAVDTICEMIVDLSGELVRSGQWLMCLHAAAVEMAGRLVIFPNSRRAGKSTLSACLAAQGHRIFSDDFFPVSLAGHSYLQGHATGISPRLRLPVPEHFSARFQGWVSAHRGPGNRRYQYLALPDVVEHGTASPLGAIMILDRQETGPVMIGEMDMTQAIEGLLHQNFARSVHSGTILKAVTEIFSAIRPQRLSYSSAEEAAEFLEEKFSRWPEKPPVVRKAPVFRVVADTDLASARPAFDPAAAYVRAQGFLEVAFDSDYYISDASGLGIHRLNPGALAIWRLLEEPMRLGDLCDVLVEAFPDVPCETVARDSEQTLRGFAENWLVVPAVAPDRGEAEVAAGQACGYIAAMTEPETPFRNFYGRIHGKTLRRSQKAYLSEDLDTLRPSGVTREDNPDRDGIDPAGIFGDDRPVWLEVGFGGGEHLVHMARQYPDVGIIGCEPYVNGVAMLLGKIRSAGVTNLSIHPGDARDLMEVLPEASIAKAFLNYPDPWPKRRHHRRRFVTEEYLRPLARVMAPGAEFRVATDIADYVRQTLVEVPRAGFELMSQGQEPWADWPSTRYEQKALREGRAPWYVTFRRR